MNTTLSRVLFTCVLLLLTTTSIQAQGTATAPSTVHVIDPSTNVVWIGGPNDPINGPGPMPIDLDANGLPWRKGIRTAANAQFGGGLLFLRETIINSGTEAWTDWHEINANIGSHGTIWQSVDDVRINGVSIAYNATVTSSTIDLDGFSQPVLPGDVFEIAKTLNAVTDNVAGGDTLVASVLEYPTVPEPGSAVLALSLGGLVLSLRQRP